MYMYISMYMYMYVDIHVSIRVYTSCWDSISGSGWERDLDATHVEWLRLRIYCKESASLRSPEIVRRVSHSIVKTV